MTVPSWIKDIDGLIEKYPGGLAEHQEIDGSALAQASEKLILCLVLRCQLLEGMNAKGISKDEKQRRLLQLAAVDSQLDLEFFEISRASPEARKKGILFKIGNLRCGGILVEKVLRFK